MGEKMEKELNFEPQYVVGQQIKTQTALDC